MDNRIKIVAGTKRIGEKIGDFKITGLGKIWNEYPTDDTACAYGLPPGLDYYPPIKQQYAYGKKETN